MKYLIVISLMLLLGCVEKQRNTQNVELFEEANKKEILFKGDTIKCYQDEKSTKYYLRYSKQSYLMPYFYMFYNDTITVNEMNVVNNADTLEVNMFQGNARTDQYKILLKEKPFLRSIHTFIHDDETDTLIVNKYLPVDTETQQKINLFINH